MAKRTLPKLQEAQAGLGLPTIMDRALAAAHGALYVHLAVFAIDIDRAYWLDPERNDLPFGWEVFLTECYVLGRIDASQAVQRDMLEAACSELMEESPGEPPLGGQLVFAIYDAVQRGALPSELRALFAGWHAKPRELVHSIKKLWDDRDATIVSLAKACLAEEMEPPLAPPTRAVLEEMAAGQFVVPAFSVAP